MLSLASTFAFETHANGVQGKLSFQNQIQGILMLDSLGSAIVSIACAFVVLARETVDATQLECCLVLSVLTLGSYMGMSQNL